MSEPRSDIGAKVGFTRLNNWSGVISAARGEVI